MPAEYPAIRRAVLTKIAKWTEWGLPNFAGIGLCEIERLDALLPPRTEIRVGRGTRWARRVLLNGSRFLSLFRRKALRGGPTEP